MCYGHLMFKILRAVRFLFAGPLILALLVVINLMTTPGHWWVKWAALGIGIAWVISVLRVVRALVLLGGVAALVAYLRKKYSERDYPQSQDAGRDRHSGSAVFSGAKKDWKSSVRDQPTKADRGSAATAWCLVPVRPAR